MCGITGYWLSNSAPASGVILKKMTDAIAHRGPDGEGAYIDGSIALGHRRLAVIDLSPGGHQPKSTEDGRYIITYNGEIYNYKELRTNLEAIGERFYTESDTEVLLKALRVWKHKALDLINGMFAFALWDKVEQTLVIARDRYGIKPLYFYKDANAFAFGSEIKAILAGDFVKSQLNSHGLVEYLTFQNFFTEQTLFKNIEMLPAGCFANIKMTGKEFSIQIHRYWDYNFTEPEGAVDENEISEELNRLFIQAVSRQLISDVDVGSYLSGGMDSGSITAIAAKQLPYIKSFTCGFDLNSASGVELGFDERQTAEYMSYLFKTEHYEMVLKAGDMERILPKLAYHLEEPRVGQSYPNFYAAQLASKFVKVVLSGTGGDELFGGYPWRYYRAVVNNDFNHYIDKYHGFWQRLIPNAAMRGILEPVWDEVKNLDTRDIFKKVFSTHQEKLTKPEDYINHSLYFEAKTFMHGLLVVEDKLSMANGLETRVPFLDNELVDFAMKIPVRMKLGNLGAVVKLNENEPGSKTDKYFNKTKDGKLILRKMMERHIPLKITQGTKQGFSAPDASWFKGESIDYVKKILLDRNANIYRSIDFKISSELINQHLEGVHNHRLLIWSLLSLEHWHKTFIK